jgi:tripartite-type tricarboxylate transporter receptor subunit TctC
MNRARPSIPVHPLVIRVIACAAGLLASTLPTDSFAQAYPAKPVRVIVGNAPGSLNDTAARLVFAKVGEALGQQFVVDNRPGAGGSIGAEAVAKAPADGYTVLNAVNTMMVVNPFLYSRLGYDPLRDFEPVTGLVKVSEVLVVHPSLGTKTVKDFVAFAKARPKQVTYASGGNGHPTHLMMELFQRKAGIALVHVPYKGTSPGVQALVSGEVAAFNIGIGLVRAHIENGKLYPLAKTGFPSKDALPGVPPLTQFYPDAEYLPWQGVFVPKGTPQEIVTRLNAAIGKALAAPEVTARLTAIDLTASGGSPGDLDRQVRADMTLNRDLIKSIGLKLD